MTLSGEVKESILNLHDKHYKLFNEIIERCDYKLNLDEKKYILKSMIESNSLDCIAVIYAHQSKVEECLKQTVQFVKRNDEGEFLIKSNSLYYSWYKTSNFDSICRLTSRHNLYDINSIKKEIIMLARVLDQEGLIKLSDELELKILRDEKFTTQEVLDLVDNIKSVLLDEKHSYEDVSSELDEAKEMASNVEDDIDNLISCINNDKNDKIDYEYLNEIVHALGKIKHGDYTHKEKL